MIWQPLPPDDALGHQQVLLPIVGVTEQLQVKQLPPPPPPPPPPGGSAEESEAWIEIPNNTDIANRSFFMTKDSLVMELGRQRLARAQLAGGARGDACRPHPTISDGARGAHRSHGYSRLAGVGALMLGHGKRRQMLTTDHRSRRHACSTAPRALTPLPRARRSRYGPTAWQQWASSAARRRVRTSRRSGPGGERAAWEQGEGA